MSQGFRVRPAELAAAGRAAAAIADQLRAQARTVLGPADAAVAALPGWRTAAALADCVEAWRLLCERLADELAGTGSGLDRTADGYRAVDEAVRHSLTAAG
ncbi:hypothetical protein [Kitasatospora sp. NPDC059571]|uniref:hypothetical protein n=1 Tax=Kitasatospora sp. NPDC059571 TaxID=3346871 RepID=UPI00367BB0CB